MTIKDIVERIEKFIPGLKGYKEKELLREEDLALRKKVEEILNNTSSNLRLAEQSLVMAGIDPTFFEERVIQQLEVLRAWVTSAECGFGGLLDSVNVEEEELKKVLENDCKLLELAEELRSSSKEVSTAVDPQKVLGSAQDILDKILKIRDLLENRKKILLGE